MQLAGISFFLSPKLPISESSILADCIKKSGGTLSFNSKQADTVVVVESWPLQDALNHVNKGQPLLMVGSDIVFRTAKHGEPFPTFSGMPILCQALRGMVVVFSGLSENSKKDCSQLVKWLGGSTQYDVSKKTSVLVVGNASSSKVVAARELDIPIVNVEWIYECFNKRICVEFASFPFKPLTGATICMDRLLPRQLSDDIRDLIEYLGAHFVAQVGKNCTHLIVNPDNFSTQPDSKFSVAVAYKISVVSLNWLYRCKSENLWVPVDDFEVSESKHSHIGTNTAEICMNIDPKNPQAPRNPFSSNAFENIRLMLCSGNDMQLQYYEQLIKSRNGIVVSSPSLAQYLIVFIDNGSAIVQSSIAAQYEKLTPSQRPVILSQYWLDASMARLQPIHSYLLLMNPVTRLVTHDATSNVRSTSNVDSTLYLKPPSSSTRKRCRETDLESSMASRGLPNKKVCSEESITTSNCVNMIDLKEETFVPSSASVFARCHFFVFGISSSKLFELIENHGGTYSSLKLPFSTCDINSLSCPFSTVKVYCVLPHGFTANYNTTASSIFNAPVQIDGSSAPSTIFPTAVTLQWIELCVKNNFIVEPSIFPYLFTPLPYSPSHYRQTMGSLHLSTASLPSSEKELLIPLLLLLGAEVTDSLLPTKTTHLICNRTFGKKQMIAISRGIPLVHPLWIYCCATSGGYVDYKDFVVKSDSSPNSPVPLQAELTTLQHPVQQNYNCELHDSPIVPYHDILRGVTIYIGKSLQSQQEELTELALQMGAETSWCLALNVTHYISVGRPERIQGVAQKTSNRKPQSSFEPKLFYVSPEWLFLCHKEKKRVPEALYPADLDARISLFITMDSQPPSLQSKASIGFFEPPHGTNTRSPSELQIQFNGNRINSMNSVLEVSKAPSKLGSVISQPLVVSKSNMSCVIVPKNSSRDDFGDHESVIDRYGTKPLASDSSAALSNVADGVTVHHEVDDPGNCAVMTSPLSMKALPSMHQTSSATELCPPILEPATIVLPDRNTDVSTMPIDPVAEASQNEFRENESQPPAVNEATLEETKRQTELMYRMIDAFLPPSTGNPPAKNLPPLKSLVSMAEPDGSSASRYISRSSVLSRSSRISEQLGAAESETNSMEGISFIQTGSDMLGLGAVISPIPILGHPNMDDSTKFAQIPTIQVSYGSKEPSEADMHLLLNKAQRQVENNAFLNSAKLELESLANFKSSSSSPASDAPPTSISSAPVTIPPKSDLAVILLEDSPPQSPKHPGRTKSSKAADTIDLDSNSVDPKPNSTWDNIFSKAKRKSLAVDQVSNSESYSTKHKPVDKLSPDNGSKSVFSASNALISIRSDIVVTFSGYDANHQAQLIKLKEIAAKFGMKVCSSSEDGWTHFIAKKYCLTDRTIISLALGRWILSPQWLEACENEGKPVPEVNYEHVAVQSLPHPNVCRKLVVKNGKGFFNGLKVLYCCSEDDTWKSILIRSGAAVESFEAKQSITTSAIRKFDLVLSSPKVWATLSKTTQNMMDKISVVMSSFFLKYLRTGLEPEDRSIFHPNYKP